MLKNLFKNMLRKWLRDRALRLPSKVVDELSKKFGIEREVIVAINDAIISWAEQELLGM